MPDEIRNEHDDACAEAGARGSDAGGYARSTTPRVSRRQVLAGTAVVAASAAALGAELGPRFYDTMRLRALQGRRVYDEHADVPALYAAARARAAAENKRILVILGGNWCRWCLSLDALMTGDPKIAAFVAEHLVLLKLDGDRARDLDEAWGWPTRHGVPVLVFLDAAGTVVHVQDSGPLEAFGGKVLAHDRGRVLDALVRWG